MIDRRESRRSRYEIHPARIRHTCYFVPSFLTGLYIAVSPPVDLIQVS